MDREGGPRDGRAVASGPRVALAAAVGGLALAVAAYLWIGSFAVLTAGLVVAALSTWRFAPAARPGPGAGVQSLAIRQLRAGIRRLPEGQVVTDPLTGARLRAERHGGFLALAVADSAIPARDSLVTRYLLSVLGITVRPPVRRLVQPLHFPGQPIGWREARRIVSFDIESGASDLTAAELAELVVMLRRASQAARPGRS
jgi:hypothetical protein